MAADLPTYNSDVAKSNISDLREDSAAEKT